MHPEGRTDKATALAGLEAMRAWMEEDGLVLKTSAPGVTPEHTRKVANGVVLLKDGCKALTRDDVVGILEVSLEPLPHWGQRPPLPQGSGGRL